VTDQPHNEEAVRLDIKTLSLIITLVITIVGVGIAWGTMNERVVGIDRHIDDHGVLILQLQDVVSDYQASEMDSKVRLTRIETDLAYIRAWIERQEGIGGG
jgi:hypothetical protein